MIVEARKGEQSKEYKRKRGRSAKASVCVFVCVEKGEKLPISRCVASPGTTGLGRWEGASAEARTNLRKLAQPAREILFSLYVRAYEPAETRNSRRSWRKDTRFRILCCGII